MTKCHRCGLNCEKDDGVDKNYPYEPTDRITCPPEIELKFKTFSNLKKSYRDEVQDFASSTGEILLQVSKDRDSAQKGDQ
jgi:hypothetical protein